MVQIAAALLFAVAAGLGLVVILAMLKSNHMAILSALLGEGAFPLICGPSNEPSRRPVALRPSTPRSAAPRGARPATAQVVRCAA